ncbi:cadmium-translocating P-type ATPase [Methanobacterium alkalithermotolerans]|uniref:Cadmium-translocating P-type ATPase n=1 Tax=Methanobacterium alkalithermotolerans TaxID=2731220 RepID=A0A8T8K484_9EURY|nr:cation-translocating P-type ATPase [Methanobacterium alkalithermotolerans]QUH22729.1 cadmium-translocating P-type ATPase [Methanobacterium alkalithermotolerans]
MAQKNEIDPEKIPAQKTDNFCCSHNHESGIKDQAYKTFKPEIKEFSGTQRNIKKKHNQNDIKSSCGCCAADLFEEKEPAKRRKHIYIINISALIFILGLYFNFFTTYKLPSEILFLMVVALSGYKSIPQGIKSFFKGKFNINFLVTIAVVGAFLIGEGAEGASVIFLFYIAEFLEERAGERARNSIGALLKLAPETATIKKNNQKLEVNVETIEPGDIVVIRPGDKIPVDGLVIEGNSDVNQAHITGESIPVTKVEGSKVFAGTLNGEGYLEVQVTKKSDETIISKIIKLVKDSRLKKSKTEAFIDRFANYYTPLVIGMALIVATVPHFILGHSFETWFYRALVLLVVSCPCALAISTPISMVSGITAASRKGILIKSGEYVEEMQNIEAMVFDKTGTLTWGKLEITDIIPLNNYSLPEISQIAASLESKSKHPLAQAMVNYAQESNIKLKEIKEFESITGKGLKGKINNKIFYIGKKSLFADNIEYPDEIIEKLENEGKTTIILGNDHHLIGVIGLSDKIRDTSINTISQLKSRRIKTIMLTGDNQGTARVVKEKLGLDEYYSGLLPEDKVKIMEILSSKYRSVAMIGDGVNDAPALARSNVGIAMGINGSDVAIETADITLMNDDLSKVDYLINLSKKTMAIVKQNVYTSILIKTSLAILAVFGFVPLWMGVLVGDMGLSIVVILNAYRIGNKTRNLSFRK